MKKSSFAAMILGTVSGVFFSLGMCMVMLPEWDAFQPGVILGCVGMVLGLFTAFVWRRMEHKTPLRITGRMVLTVFAAAAGTLALGIGMCLCIIWGSMIPGIVIGIFGILVLLCMIPVVRGFR
jgi:uncharacterized membrane protein